MKRKLKTKLLRRAQNKAIRAQKTMARNIAIDISKYVARKERRANLKQKNNFVTLFGLTIFDM